jgi:hypothetical protein
MTLGNASLPDHVDAEIPSPLIHSLGSKGQNVWERPPEATKTTRRPKKTIMALDFLSFFRREEVQLSHCSNRDTAVGLCREIQ